MKLWSDFYNLLQPDLPGCPFVALDHAVRNSAIAFCEQSLAWTYEHPDIAIVPDLATYDFVPPAEALVHTVLYARFNETDLDTQTKDADMRIWNWRNQSGSPQYLLGTPSGLRLVPKPDLVGTLTLIVALKPDDDAIGIDDEIYQEYREAIIHGAKARLMLSPRKPYTDAALASFHMGQFTAKTTAAGIRAARNYTRAPLQTTIMNRR